MSPGRESDRTPDASRLREAPVDKYLRLAAEPEGFLRGDSGEGAGAYVMLNVGRVTTADRSGPDAATPPPEPGDSGGTHD